MLILALLAIVGGILFYYYIVKPFHYWTERGVEQGTPPWIFGDNWGPLSNKQSFAEMVEMVYKRGSRQRYSGMYQLFVPVLVLKDLELIKQITIKDFDHFTDHKSIIPEDSDPLWGKNLFQLKGQKWREMRSILSPSFTSSKMKIIFSLIKESSEKFVQHFLNNNEEVVTVELQDTFTRFTNDVIATTAFGIEVDSLGQPNNHFYLMGKEAVNFNDIWRILKLCGYFICPKLYEIFNISLSSPEVSKFFRTIVSDTIKIREEKGVVRPDMINLLLEARKGIQRHEENEAIDTGFSTAPETDTGKTKLPKDITDIDIAAQAVIFFFGGFDSVSGLLSFVAYELAANPEVQDRLRQEVKSTMEECEGNLTYEALLKMKYMDMVVSETLRKWPTAIAVDRVCTKPYTITPMNNEEKPIRLNVGDMIWLPIFGIHRDPDYFPNPERFDPERFSEENKQRIKPYTYLPFGLGPRNCIGSRFALLETKALFFHILNSFEIVPVEKSTIPLTIAKGNFNLLSEGGFWFGFKCIKN